VPLVNIVEQELALKRARLEAEKAKPSRPAERWLALMLILLVLLGVTVWGFIWGWGRIQSYKARQDKPPQPPPAAPARR
jgi:cytoskeletal protein RodZ